MEGGKINHKLVFYILILIVFGMTFSCVAAHPGHGEYHPEEVVSPSASYSSPSPSQDSSSGSSQVHSQSSSSADSSSQSSQSSSSGSSNNGGGSSASSYESSKSQSSNDNGASEVVLDNGEGNVSDNATNESNVNESAEDDNDDSSVFTVTNVAILICAFLFGFAVIVLLHKIKVI